MVGATALAYPGDPSLGPYGPLSLRADALGMRGHTTRSEDRIHRVERTFRKFTDHREVLPNVARSLLVDRLNNEKNAVERHPG